MVVAAADMLDVSIEVAFMGIQNSVCNVPLVILHGVEM